MLTIPLLPEGRQTSPGLPSEPYTAGTVPKSKSLKRNNKNFRLVAGRQISEEKINQSATPAG
jgi:hypothetical protein